nr:hypothetical protein CFP56_49784 [Quercus suber]
MQAVPSDGHGVTRRREGSVFEEVDSFVRPLTVVEVGQVENLGTEIVHEAQLEKVIVGLTISETEASQVPRVDQDCQAKTTAHAVQSDSLVDNDLSQTTGPTLLTKAWKRLTHEVGKVTKDNTSDIGALTVDNNINSRKKRMCIDFEDHMESRKFCMDLHKGEKEQTFELADDTRVSFLIDQDRFAWKESVVKEFFLLHEVDIILGIPLSFWRPPDRIAWAHTPSGVIVRDNSGVAVGALSVPISLGCSMAELEALACLRTVSLRMQLALPKRFLKGIQLLLSMLFSMGRVSLPAMGMFWMIFEFKFLLSSFFILI